MAEKEYKKLLSKMEDLKRETKRLADTHENLLAANSQMILIGNTFSRTQRDISFLSRGIDHNQTIDKK